MKPRTTFVGDSKITGWGITWRKKDSETFASLGFVCKQGQRQVPGGLRFKIIAGNKWQGSPAESVCLLIASVAVTDTCPVNCFAIVLPALKCITDMCSKEAQDVAHWSAGHAESAEKVLDVINTHLYFVAEIKWQMLAKPASKKRTPCKTAVEAGADTVTPETGET